MKKKAAHINKKPQFERSVEKHFYELDARFSVGHKAVYAVLLGLAFFGIMGLIWMIPFPQFGFLVKMNMHTFLNWGSFFIAIVVYSYLKLAPTLSYAMLFTISIMSYFIVQLEYVERDGGPAVVLICGLVSLVGLAGLWLMSKRESGVDGNAFMKLLGIGPIWLWSKVFDKLKWRY